MARPAAKARKAASPAKKSPTKTKRAGGKKAKVGC